jgi:RimJ/RimL family protein N-acetyltransferase
VSALAPIVLEGRHVRLEPLSLGHVQALRAAATGPRETYAYIAVPRDEAEMTRYIETALADQQASRAVPFATRARATGRIVGSTRFGNIERWSWPEGNPNQRGADRPDAVEIGWTWLAADAQRTAINTEAKLLMLSHAFERWRVHRVHLKTDARNTRSREAILRLGGRLDGILRGHMVGTDGTVRDSAWYSILEAEWAEVRQRLLARLAQGAAPA